MSDIADPTARSRLRAGAPEGGARRPNAAPPAEFGREHDGSIGGWDLAADVLDTIEDGFYIVDPDWRFVHVNRRACEMWGKPSETVLGRTLWECFPDVAGTSAGQRLREAVQSRQPATFEGVSAVLRGWLRVRVIPLRERLTGVYIRDIDNEKRAVSELLSSEERLRIASQAARLGYWERDLATGQLRCSDQCKANYGLPAETELSCQQVFAAIHPDYRDQAREASRRAVEQGTIYESEYPIAWPDGGTHWISVRGRCLYGEDGTPLRTVGVTIDITERKRAEEALRDSEERFRRVFEQSPLGKAVAGPDFRLREVNPALCAMLGYGRDELIGLTFLDFVHPEDRENCLEQASALASGRIARIQLEERFIHKSGEAFWVSVNVAPVHGDGQQALYTLGLIEDISERKRLEEELKESEERYRLFADAATEGVLVHDFRTVLDVSGRFAEMFGFRPEELVGTTLDNWPMLVTPDALTDALVLGKSGQFMRHELACRRRDGTPIELEYSAKDISYRGRRVRLMIARDITERKRNEQRLGDLNEHLEQQAEERARQLYASRARLRAFFENSPDRMTLQRATEDGRFVYEDVNPACERAWGVRREEIIGRTLIDAIGSEYAELPLHYYTECVRTGMPQRFVVQRTYSGQTCTLDVMAVLVPGETEGGDRFIITTARDITEREQLEAQLRQAQKMEAVGQLTGGVAHDFNNLLTAVVSSLELIRTKTAEDRVRRLADTALRAAMRGGELTHQLLSFSRRQNLRPAVVDLGALLRETEALLRRAAGEAIAVTFAADPDLWRCEVDPAQFEAAVMNLVVNARDAMPEGGRLALVARNAVVGAVEAGLDLPIGDYIVLEVSDTGSGMSPEVLVHAFEPFFTTKEIGKGSGLGLSMVHGFARQSGGTVRIESAHGLGTTVRLYLPKAWAGVPAAAVLEGGLEDLPRSSGTLLVVEDNEELLNAVMDVLRSLNYRVFVAINGPQAMEVIRRGEPIDLLLSDIVLPAGMTGIELAREARVLRPGMKVLLTSGYTGEAIPGAGQEFPFLAKPYRPTELGRRIGELLKPLPLTA